jgi:hypothetical protein
MQEGRCRVICVNADADLDNDLEVVETKNGTQCVPFFISRMKTYSTPRRI